VVKISFSSAFLQIGRFCAMQKARLHWLQAAEAGARCCREEEGGMRVERAKRFGEVGGVALGVSSIMVLLVKQVHLQKEDGAGMC